MKKVAVLGSGAVGDVLSNGFLTHGYAVTRATREPAKLEAWKKAAKGEAAIATYADAAKWADIIVLAVKGSVAEEVLDQCGAANLANKTIIDTTNPIGNEPPDHGVIRYFTNANESLMERLQKKVPAAKFVKAFNSVGNVFMVNPKFETTPTMFYCGNDTAAKAEVADVLTKFGHEPFDCGGVEAARPIESLCILWCIPGFIRNDWAHSFKMIKPAK
ncbi:MAG TPA: NAD(P)-binding domain-containing protein [Kofleriaceae bacterium]|nr:NAD(P)-binding domain-containing protein [Kofleriaceae bacterium]